MGLIYVQNVKKDINNPMDPNKIIEIEYRELHNAIQDGKHEYHCFYFATIQSKIPQLRTVVLRALNKEKNSISFHSDSRSNKVKEIKSNNNVSALFYDKKRRIQIRLQGKALIDENSKELKRIWSSMKSESKLCYMGPFAPGKKLNYFQPNLPNHNAQNITPKNNTIGYKNFCRVTINLEKLDWLQLHHKGHKRQLFYFHSNSKPTWIAS